MKAAPAKPVAKKAESSDDDSSEEEEVKKPQVKNHIFLYFNHKILRRIERSFGVFNIILGHKRSFLHTVKNYLDYNGKHLIYFRLKNPYQQKKHQPRKNQATTVMIAPKKKHQQRKPSSPQQSR